MELVGLARACTSFPHAFSGGQRQRIGVARALARARADGARRAGLRLDVSIQAGVVNLLKDLQAAWAWPTCYRPRSVGGAPHLDPWL